MYDKFNIHFGANGQSAPTPTIHVSSLVCEFQLYDDVEVVTKNGGALGS